jgi:hypothetical protein
MNSVAAVVVLVIEPGNDSGSNDLQDDGLVGGYRLLDALSRAGGATHLVL